MKAKDVPYHEHSSYLGRKHWDNLNEWVGVISDDIRVIADHAGLKHRIKSVSGRSSS